VASSGHLLAVTWKPLSVIVVVGLFLALEVEAGRGARSTGVMMVQVKELKVEILARYRCLWQEIKKIKK
jgi:hypothetical protein